MTVSTQQSDLTFLVNRAGGNDADLLAVHGLASLDIIKAGALSTGAASANALRTSGTVGVGYATGAGGAVTQITNRSTGVTLSKLSGTITTDSTSLAAAAEATFIVTNTLVAITDVVVVAVQSGGTTAGSTWATVTAVAAGSFSITVSNMHASTADTAALLINFAVIKAVAA